MATWSSLTLGGAVAYRSGDCRIKMEGKKKGQF